jgi:hypothetical protein
MQRVTLVRYTAKPDQAAANEALARAVFTDLRAAAPNQVTYTLFQNGLEFIHLFVNLQHDDSTALTELSSFKIYMQDLAARCDGPVDVTRLSLDLLESYGTPAAPVSI